MDFFALMFEEWLTKVTKPFDSIGNPAVRTILQIGAMILCCAISVGIILGIDALISFVCKGTPFADNRIVRVIVGIVNFILCLVLIALFIRLVSWVISFFVR